MNSRKAVIGIGIFVMLVMVLVIVYRREPAVSSIDAAELYITNLQAGEADAAIIRYKNHAGMIDVGLEENYDVIAAELKRQGIGALSFLILTHYDKDHIGGACKLLEEYPVDRIFVPDYEGQGERYSELKTALTGHSGVVTVSEKQIITYEDMILELYPPEDKESILSGKGERDNDMSIVSKITFKDEVFLFLGDIEKRRTKQLLASQEDFKADWIKYPHHGRYKKYQEDFIKVIAPEWAIISSDKMTEASEETVKMLDKEGILVYGTWQGNVQTVSDGESINVLEGL